MTALGMDVIARNFQGSQVRLVMIDGEPWFVAADVCRVLEIANPTDALKRLDDDERARFNLGLAGSAANMVNQPGLYSLILGSRKPEAKAFKRWITHEVLPSIRKTGSYGVRELSRLDLARMAFEAETENARLAAKIEADAPKVILAETITASDSTILVGELAKLLCGVGVEIGEQRLFALLREERYLISGNRSDRNMPTQRAMELGLFVIHERPSADGSRVYKTTRVTTKGQQYFIDRYVGRLAA